MRYFCVMFIAILLSTTAYSQDESTVEFLPAGKWGLQFQINIGTGFWPQITSYQGSIISGKYQLSPSTALRFGLGVSFNGGVSERQNSQTTSSSSALTTIDGGSFNGGGEIVSQYIWYLVQYEEVYFYTGVGPTLQVNYNTSSSDIDGQTSDRYYLALGFGASGVAGVEWLCLNWLSLSAEYNSSLVYTYAKDRFENNTPLVENEQTITSSTIRLSSRSITIGATIFF